MGVFSYKIKALMTEIPKYKYIYGPVTSWRIGRSLGIDPLSSVKKACTFDCVYCQAGRTEVLPTDRSVYVPTEALLNEVRSLPHVVLDFITFAGNGEPTLAANLGEMILGIRALRKEKIAVITNASLIDRPDVQADLRLADRVEAKLDAASPASFSVVNQPAKGVVIENVIAGLKVFRKMYQGQLILQVMFLASNKANAEAIAKIALEIAPDLVEINTPLRACAVKPLSPEDLAPIAEVFHRVCGEKIPVRSVYEAKREKSRPFCQQSTDRRRGKE